MTGRGNNRWRFDGRRGSTGGVSVGCVGVAGLELALGGRSSDPHAPIKPMTGMLAPSFRNLRRLSNVFVPMISLTVVIDTGV